MARPIPLDAKSSLPRNLHCLMQQIKRIFRAPVHRPRRGRGRGAGIAARGPRSPPSSLARRGGRRCDDGAAARGNTGAGSTNSSTLATRQGTPVVIDMCMAPERILVESPHHCESRGCIARVRTQQEKPGVMTSFCPHHGWTKHLRRAISPSPSPDYSPATPLHTLTPADPPEFLLRGTIPARRGAPPFYMEPGGSSSPVLIPPSPPLDPPFPGRPTAAAAANARPGLRRIIKNGHVPAKTSGGGKASRPPPSGEGET